MTIHRATHRLAQAYSDLTNAETEVVGFGECDRRHRALCFIREAQGIIKHTLDEDLLNPLLKEDV